MAARDGPDGLAPPDVRPARGPHAALRPRAWSCPGPSRPSTTRSSARCSPSSRTPTSRRPRSSGRTGEHGSHRPRRPDRAAWWSTRSAGGGCSAARYQPPDAPLSRGLEVHPWGAGEELEIWIDRRYVPAGYGWSFPAGDELRIGVGSFDPRFHVKDTTVMLAEDLERDPVRYQGNWIPHRLRDATEDGVFFVGDSAGHCLPLTAEGIRTALYFGIALRPRAARGGRGQPQRRPGADAATATSRPRTTGSSARCCAPSAWCRACRRACSRAGWERWQSRRFLDWAFGHYLAIAPPEFVAAGPPPARAAAGLAARAAASKLRLVAELLTPFVREQQRRQRTTAIVTSMPRWARRRPAPPGRRRSPTIAPQARPEASAAADCCARPELVRIATRLARMRTSASAIANDQEHARRQQRHPDHPPR